jgi:hypothetical protein
VRLGWVLLLGILCALLSVAVLLTQQACVNFLARMLGRVGCADALPGVKASLSWPGIGIGLSLALATNVLTILGFACSLRAFGGQAPFFALMLGMAALSFLLILPISISGWGLREVTLSALLAYWAVSVTDTVLAGLSFGLIALLVYLPGMIVLWRQKSGKTGRCYKPTLQPKTKELQP